MKKYILKRIMVCGLLAVSLHTGKATAQGMHFSQYYNAPMLLNPANTALMNDNDYRIGVNYRNQWAKIPVPYQTMSGYADFQLLREKNQTNWMGMGLAFFNDKAGDGELQLTQYQGSLAYHVQMGEQNLISVGLSGAYVQRSVDFSKLSFDKQWDGFKFDPGISNSETNTTASTKFLDVGAGINFVFFPQENSFLKISLGAAHLNQPTETFYGSSNKVHVRPTANVDALLPFSETFSLNPSIYYTTQNGSYELIYGTLAIAYLGGDKGGTTSLVLGAFHRWNEAVIGAFGLQWGGVRFIANYDFTVSKLSSANKSNGALEFGIVYYGNYVNARSDRGSTNCLRF